LYYSYSQVNGLVVSQSKDAVLNQAGMISNSKSVVKKKITYLYLLLLIIFYYGNFQSKESAGGENNPRRENDRDESS